MMEAFQTEPPAPMTDYPEYEESTVPQHAYCKDSRLHVPENAAVPTGICVGCGRPSEKVVSKAIRKPLNPLTWYTKQTSVEIGLCKKHVDDRRVGVALTFSFLVLGIIFLVAGIVTLSVGMIGFGLVAAAISGYFRARMPVYRSEPEGWVLKIEGAGEGFLKQLPQYEGTDGI